MRGTIRIVLSFSLLMNFGAPGSFADQPAMERAYITAGAEGNYYFKMIPSNYQGKPARGQAYEVMAEGPDRPTWAVSGWYSPGTYLSYDGEYLVRLGTWSFAGKPTAQNLGIAFYKRGLLVKEHSIKDLVVDPSKARKTVSFYHYLAQVDGIAPTLDSFILTTCDGIEYKFDLKTGAIVAKKSVPAPSLLSPGR